MKRILPCGFLVLAVVSGLVGCSSGKQDSESSSSRVALVARFVSNESVESFEAYLQAELPEYNDETRGVSVVGVSGGDSAADPMSAMAGSTRIAGMLAAREIELWIADAESARRYADTGANYVALDELFTAKETSSFGGTPIAIPLADREGNLTGESSEIVGIDLSQKRRSSR